MKHPIRISHLGLLESAPLLAAQACGFFSTEGLDVELSCELGVAAICGKLGDCRVEGACLPAQMPVLMSLGAGTTKVPLHPVFVTSSQGMAIVLTKKSATPEKNRGSSVLKIGVLAHSSPACYLVKRWLQLNPTFAREEPVFASLAASQLTYFLEEGFIDGFCGLDPLPMLAQFTQDGLVVATSATLSPNHPGSVICLRSDCATERPHLVPALARALRRGQEYCADPANINDVWAMTLAQNPFGCFSEQDRHALLQHQERDDLFAPSIRFESAKTNTGLDATGALFLEQACRAALSSSERHLNVGAEVARLYLKAA